MHPKNRADREKKQIKKTYFRWMNGSGILIVLFGFLCIPGLYGASPSRMGDGGHTSFLSLLVYFPNDGLSEFVPKSGLQGETSVCMERSVIKIT